ncbi:MAG: AAA family ATPase [Methanomassiliicoccales archaeon]|jgi:Holliday junction DNA helicase RuvB
MNDNNTIQVEIIQGSTQNSVHPEVFDNIVGQDAARKKLSFYVRSHSPATPFPSMIFTGSHGLGKSYLSSKTAEAIGREIVEVNCAAIPTATDFIEGVLFSKVLGSAPKTILMDEAHELSDEVTTLLLTLLNPNENHINYLNYKNWSIVYDMSKINIIFATTNAHAMFKPLLNRCTEIYFDPYNSDELFRIVRQYTSPLKLNASKSAIAYACRGRARDAYVLSQNIQRYCTMTASNTLSNADWEDLANIFGIYPMGLNAQEVKVLNILSKSSAMSCRSLAIQMMVDEKNVEQELEVRPKELGLIENTPKGRHLTKNGLLYLRKLNKDVIL